MSAPTHITDHSTRAVARLLSVVRRDDPALVELVTILGALIQECEDLVWACIHDRQLDANTVGAQLDAWGRVLGRPRGGLDDDVYRRVLRAWQGALRSQGRGNQILEAMHAVSAATAVEIHPTYPAAIEVDLLFDGGEFPLASELVDIMLEVLEAATASGVAFILVAADDTTPFRFDDPDLGFDQGLMGVELT